MLYISKQDLAEAVLSQSSSFLPAIDFLQTFEFSSSVAAEFIEAADISKSVWTLSPNSSM